MPKEISDRVRITLDLTPKLHDLLEKFATETEKSKSEVIRDALKVLLYISERTKDGHKIVIEKDGNREQVVFIL